MEPGSSPESSRTDVDPAIGHEAKATELELVEAIRRSRTQGMKSANKRHRNKGKSLRASTSRSQRHEPRPGRFDRIRAVMD